jgi:hypothetical protein
MFIRYMMSLTIRKNGCVTSHDSAAQRILEIETQTIVADLGCFKGRPILRRRKILDKNHFLKPSKVA